MAHEGGSSLFRMPLEVPRRSRAGQDTHMGDPLPTNHEFQVPEKQLLDKTKDLSRWLSSAAYQEYFGFINAMNLVCRGKVCKPHGSEEGYPYSEVGEQLMLMLDKLDEWTLEIEPLSQEQRFGNQAFRIWHGRLEKEALNLLSPTLPQELRRAVSEFRPYLLDSFGNSTRIDYGTGHEMAFVMLLYCFFRTGALKEADQQHTMLTLFPRYLEVCRKLQMRYRFEPAGSRGVWALDDFQFLPFLWGSSQMIGLGKISPDQFPNPEVARNGAKENMLLACIDYIHKNKTGPFHEHSNLLWNISGTQSWNKLNQGMLKMYQNEVLAKWPVVQHVLFGSLLTLQPAPSPPPGAFPDAPRREGLHVEPFPSGGGGQFPAASVPGTNNFPGAS